MIDFQFSVLRLWFLVVTMLVLSLNENKTVSSSFVLSLYNPTPFSFKSKYLLFCSRYPNVVFSGSAALRPPFFRRNLNIEANGF
jgi:hypothetical protein